MDELRKDKLIVAGAATPGRPPSVRFVHNVHHVHAALPGRTNLTFNAAESRVNCHGQCKRFDINGVEPSKRNRTRIPRLWQGKYNHYNMLTD